MKILIIDDNATNLKLAGLILRQKGYEVLQTIFSVEGISYAEQESPDLILLDIQMPGMNGLEVNKLLKENPLTKNIPVVAFTAYAMKGDAERFVQSGFADYISKPINVDEFIEKIAFILNKK